MFGHRFFGARYFGPSYWGDGGGGAPVVVAESVIWEPILTVGRLNSR